MIYFNEADCLAVDPFAGDFGGPGDRVLENKIVTARRASICSCCELPTAPKSRVRVIKAVFDGKLMSYRYCTACCAAMAVSEKDDGKAWERRIALRDA